MSPATHAEVGAPATALAGNLCQTDLLNRFALSRRCTRVSRLYRCGEATARAIVLRQVAGPAFADALLESRHDLPRFSFGPASAVVDLAKALERVGRRYLVTGSLASSIWDRPRLLKDIDVVLDVQGSLDELIDSLGESFLFLAERSRSSLVHSMYAHAAHRTSGFRIELFFRQTAEGFYSRATRFHYGDEQVALCVMPPEELLVSRLIFLELECPNQAVKLIDAKRLWERCGPGLDLAWLAHLAGRFGVKHWLDRVEGERG